MRIKIDYTLELGNSQIERLKEAYELDQNGWGHGLYREGDTFRQWIKSMVQLSPKTFSDIVMGPSYTNYN